MWAAPLAAQSSRPAPGSADRATSQSPPATYLPPVHVAPRRTAADAYPGVYEPDAGLPSARTSQNFSSGPTSKSPRGTQRQANRPRPPQPDESAGTPSARQRKRTRNSILTQSADPPTDSPAETFPNPPEIRTVAARQDELDAQFAELEQPLERISQTPAPPESRPVDNSAWRAQENSASVLGDDRSPAPTGEPRIPAWPTGSRRPAAAPEADYPTLPMENSLRENEGAFGSSAASDSPPVEIINREFSQDLSVPQATLSCDELRKRLLSAPITSIALDLSPPGPKHTLEGTQSLPSGDWTDLRGQMFGAGRMTDLSRGYVLVETEQGLRRVPYSQLNDSGMSMVAKAWQIPAECTIGTGTYQGRCWTPQMATWYAANNCHKPLYFEDEQLERYGHSAGPYLGPIRSTAHFFADFAMWPYKTAIHPPNECLYALGFYRPGNCAPWLADPLPISLRGAARQSVLLSGFVFLF